MIDTIGKWHELVAARDMAALDEILAEDVVFHSPVVHAPQAGKALTKMYLGAAHGVTGIAYTMLLAVEQLQIADKEVVYISRIPFLPLFLALFQQRSIQKLLVSRPA